MWLWIYAALWFLHPFYLSVFEIEINEKRKKVEMSVKMFTDDTENMLKTIYQRSFFLQKELGKNQTIDSLLLQYLQQHVVLSLDHQPLKWQWVGAEIEGDALWCYLETPTYQSAAQQMSLKNTFFFNLFDTQTNIVHIRKGQQKKSMLLKGKENTVQVTFYAE